MTKNEIVGRLKDGGLDASSTNRSAAVYVADAIAGRAVPGWFAFRIVCDSEDTERRARAIMSRWYDIDVNGNGVWRMRAKNRVPLMAIKRGVVPPTPPTPTDGPMYFEAVEANSTVSLMSMLTTAPDLEYSTDGETWQEWQHTTADNTHTFDTLTLTAVGDRVYLRGDNPNGFNAADEISAFMLTGSLESSGNILSLLAKDMTITDIPTTGLAMLFVGSTALVSTPDLSKITSIGAFGLFRTFDRCENVVQSTDMDMLQSVGNKGLDSAFARTGLEEPIDMPVLVSAGSYALGAMYEKCLSLTRAANMPLLASIGDSGCEYMYGDCTFDMSNDGTTLNFSFPTPPVTAGETTYATAYDIADWMGNTNGFTTP